MAEQISGTENSAAVQLRKQLSTCDQRLNQYRAALNAGADAVQVARWINDTEQERARLEGELRAIPADQAVSSDGLAELLHETGELAHAVVNAHPDDKADLYAKLGLKMMYYPQKKLVEAKVVPTSTCANGLCPRGDHNQMHMPTSIPIGDVYRIPVGKL
ncbi:hypothetical protein [Actinomadura sp. 7K507]|uniref:hypothetical protein n=1 Tax=Actinomadura sp. 7K507 TaxID=2530365 RepID=UPI001052E2D3|nr:hypothetical protein [Actinomadura sp. 7K507]TDC86932.1 hypothetical protein E1285_21675 [Actinomadura sp. 7K507]